MTLLTILRPQPPYFETLLGTARRLLDEKEYAIAVVVAHMAFEVAAEQAFSRLIAHKGIEGPLEEAVLAILPDRTFQRRESRDLWAALTNGDRISKAQGWKAYDASVERRNAAVHSGAKVTGDEAQASVDAVIEVMTHVNAVTKRTVAAR